MALFLLILFLLSIFYAGFLIWCWFGWLKIAPPSITNNQTTAITVIIPARNEEQSISNLLEDLIIQKYPTSLFEVIIVNDHSTDRTVEIVKLFIQNHKQSNVQLLDLSLIHSEIFSKKNAITAAINIANGELIITTDADCRVGANWVASIADFYKANHSLLISGPVKYSFERNRFEKIQSLEFMGLIAIGAGAISNHQPIICNGANLAFTKEVFNKVNGFSGKRNLATGDDTQLLTKISGIDKNRIHFLKSTEATVTTTAKQQWRDLFSQRKRWASKIPYQMNALSITVAVVAYITNTGFLVGTILLMEGVWSLTDHLGIPFFQSSILLFFSAIILKIAAEFLVLHSSATFFEKKKFLWLLLPAQIYYCFYVAIVGIASLFGTYEWKGRRTR